MITNTTIAAISIGILCLAFVIILLQHMHGKCFLHAVIDLLSIVLHMLHCYSKKTQRKAILFHWRKF